MHLAYLTYGNEVRLVIYRTDPADPKEIFVSLGGQRSQFHAYAPDILVGPAFTGRQGFSLQSNDGACQARLENGKLLVDRKQGVFRDMKNPTKLTELQTIAVEANRYSTELPATDIIPLSHVYNSYERRRQYFVLLRPTKEQKGLRVSGWSTERGGIVAPLKAALAVVVSGEDIGWVGFVLWGDNGGIALGGADGIGEPWALLNSYERLPQKVRDDVLIATAAIGVSMRRDTGSLAGSR